MWNKFKALWFDIVSLDFAYDLEDGISFDILRINCGGKKGVLFNGSLLMFYCEFPDSHYRDGEWHFDWDILFLKQFITRRG